MCCRRSPWNAILLAALAASVLVTGCNMRDAMFGRRADDPGKPTTKSNQAAELVTLGAAPVNSLSVEGPIKLTWQPGGPEVTYRVDGDSEAASRLEAEIIDGTARFKLDGDGKLEVVVSSPQPTTWRVAGDGSLVANDLEGGSHAVGLAGSGTIILSGKAAKLTTSLSGSGQIEAFDLQVDEAAASLSGSGQIQVNALTKLTARIAGTGIIEYDGDPQVETTIAGSGKVRPR